MSPDEQVMAEQTLTVRDASGGGQPPSTPAARDAGGEGGFGIYKWGRGYWVRVLTAIAVGMLFLAGAGWAWKNLATVSLPAKGYTAAVAVPSDAKLVTGVPASFVNVIDGKDFVVGTGTVESVQASPDGKRADITVGQFKPADGGVMRDAKRVDLGSGDTAIKANIQRETNAITKIPVFSPTYLQGGVAGAMLLTGLIAIYAYVGRKPSSVDFLIATDEEMRKVNWSNRKTITNSTLVVISATFLIAGFIFIWDTILKKALMDWIVAW
jgi:preprotein translocase SecE subunit